MTFGNYSFLPMGAGGTGYLDSLNSSGGQQLGNVHSLFTKFSALPAIFVPGKIKDIFVWLEANDSITILPDRREEQGVEVKIWCEDGRLN